MRFASRSRRVIRWIVLPVLIAGMMTQVAPRARADDPAAELEKAQNKLEAIQRLKAQVKDTLNRAYLDAEEARQKLNQVDNDLVTANSQLAVITNQLTSAQGKVTQIDAELVEAKKQVAQHKEMLSKRLRAINEEGRVNYLAVLFGSASFSDFMSRFDMLKIVVKKDAQLFEVVRKDKQVLEDKQLEAIARKNRLEDLKAQAETRRNTIAVKRDERVQVSRSLEASKRFLQAQYDAYDRDEQAMMEQVVEIQRRANRQAGRFSPIFPITRPIIITDPFGPRLHPILQVWRQHTGTDFNASMGSPVFAIEDGTVIVAGWNNSYGNLIVIDHGGGYSSWYGHASKLLVKVNDKVVRNQRIALAGSTGMSTGPHVHLEVRVDGKPMDPMKYLPKL